MNAEQSQRRRWSGSLAAGVCVAMLTAFFSYSLEGSTRALYLPGPTTSGHYQIELACDACHSKAFSDQKVLQESCVRCHAAELKEAEDSHPEAKFRDPRNASRVEVLDARYCVTCHREHRPEVTTTMGLSLPTDYCYRCHETIGDERATHKGLSFDSCQTDGCHNFHDNRALYEDFLVKHQGEPMLLPNAKTPARQARDPKKPALAASAQNAPADLALEDKELVAWAQSAHGQAGTNCSDCHQAGAGAWQAQVSTDTCGKCHKLEREGYLAGRHGMREAQGLESLRVKDARHPMHPDAQGRTLSCSSCHSAHDFDTRKAAVDACLNCHADEHSLAYSKSKHAELFKGDPSGTSGASCATCHLPRIEGPEGVVVHHNQNDTLRPNEKMIRSVCMNCHGLGETIDALADPALIKNNFSGRPKKKIKSIEWAASRVH